ncbi:hypothetical protein SLE2022_194260 [Rubroshorea leprosula]
MTKIDLAIKSVEGAFSGNSKPPRWFHPVPWNCPILVVNYADVEDSAPSVKRKVTWLNAGQSSWLYFMFSRVSHGQHGPSGISGTRIDFQVDESSTRPCRLEIGLRNAGRYVLGR